MSESYNHLCCCSLWLCALYSITNYAIRGRTSTMLDLVNFLLHWLSFIKVAYWCEMVFCHFVNHFMNKYGREAIFNTKMFDSGSFIFLNCIDLKWQEMH